MVQFPDPHQQSTFMREATNLEMDPNEPDNKIKLVRKKLIMERIGGQSTNFVDAAMLTLAEEDPSMMEDPTYIKDRLLSQLLGLPQQTQPTYDPLSYMTDQEDLK